MPMTSSHLSAKRFLYLSLLTAPFICLIVLRDQSSHTFLQVDYRVDMDNYRYSQKNSTHTESYQLKNRVHTDWSDPKHRPDIQDYLEGIPSCEMQEVLDRKTSTETNNNDSLYWLQGRTRCAKSDHVRRLPCALLIGERKTGTGPIRRFLKLINPQIQFAPREAHFFNQPGNIFTQKSFAGYANKMPASCPGDVTMEKTPSYFRTSFAAKKIYKWNRHVRLLLSLRDPIERAVSDYYFVVRCIEIKEAKGVRVQSYQFMKQFSFEQMAVTSQGKANYSLPALRRSLYDISLKPWLKYFPQSQLHVIDADTFAHQNPAAQLRKIESFLGLEPKATEEAFIFNTTKGHYCLGSCMGEEKGHSHPALSARAHKVLTKYFVPHVRKLHSMLGQKLSWMSNYGIS